jgi:hypothetical protein
MKLNYDISHFLEHKITLGNSAACKTAASFLLFLAFFPTFFLFIPSQQKLNTTIIVTTSEERQHEL